MKLLPADSILFDLDGTLWNSAAAATQAWNQTLTDHGWHEHHLEQSAIESFSGLPVERILSEKFSFIPEDSHAEIITYYKGLEAQEMKIRIGILYTGVRETLSVLSARFKLFIISNCIEGYIENFLEAHGLASLFTDFECSGNTGMSKGKNIELVIQRNKLLRPVYIGDTIWDQEAAGSNQMPFIYAAYGFGKLTSYDFSIHAFPELENMLEAP